MGRQSSLGGFIPVVHLTGMSYLYKVFSMFMRYCELFPPSPIVHTQVAIFGRVLMSPPSQGSVFKVITIYFRRLVRVVGFDTGRSRLKNWLTCST